MMKLLAAQCGQNFFEIAYEFFGCACLYYEKKITSRMVEEQNLVKLLQGEKNRNKNEMRLHIQRILATLCYTRRYTFLYVFHNPFVLSPLADMIVVFFIFHYIIPSLISS